MSNSTADTNIKQLSPQSSGSTGDVPADTIEAAAAAATTSQVVSSFIKLSDGSRTRADAVATVSRKGSKLFLKDSNGDFLIVLEFQDDDDAEAELTDVNEQLDRYEAAHSSRVVTRSDRSSKQGMRRR